MDIASVLVVTAVLLLLASIFFFQRQDQTAGQAAKDTYQTIQGQLTQKANKSDADKTQADLTLLTARVVTKADDSDIEALKHENKKLWDEIAVLQSRINGFALNKAKQERTVIHRHEYTKPMQVDLSYPTNAPVPKMPAKGRGQKSLLERAKQ